MHSKLLVSLALATLFVACGKKEAAPAATSTAPAPAAPANTATTGFGVAECDTYVKLYMECVESKVPEMVRGQVKEAFATTRAEWQKIAATAEGRAGLAAACTQATEIAKTAMSAYGCTF